jgi:hypothetical protein
MTQAIDTDTKRQEMVGRGQSRPVPAARAISPRPGASRTSSSIVSKVAWIPEGELRHEEWVAAGRRLGAIGRCSQWWVGDWIRYGTSKWGEKYAEAARVTGYDVASLRNMAWVASRFDPSEPEEQRYWIDRAGEMRFSVADLRIELRVALRKGKPEPGEAAHAAASSVEVACPHCGHEFVVDADARPASG